MEEFNRDAGQSISIDRERARVYLDAASSCNSQIAEKQGGRKTYPMGEGRWGPNFVWKKK
jgi:hypothetical protein